MTHNANEFLKEGKIMTSASDSTCGINLKNGTLYLIAAKSPMIGLCNYVKEYSKMTIVEKRGFAGGYKKGCLCDVIKKKYKIKDPNNYLLYFLID